MSHITEKLTEFIFEELSPPEMAEAKRHLTECSNCRDQVDRFQQTLALLKTAPEIEPPRNIVFEFEKPVAGRLWRWLPAAVAIAAVFVLTIAMAGRVHIQWHDSELTIAFGQIIPPDQTSQAAELVTDIQNMKGYLEYLKARQEAVERSTVEIAARIQPTAGAQRSPAGD